MNHRISLLITLLVSGGYLLSAANAELNHSQSLAITTQQGSEAYTQEAIAEIFGNQPPAPYKTQQGGVVNEPDKTHGYYLLLSDPVSDVVALIMDIRMTGRREGLLLRKGSFKRVAEQLSRKYLKTSRPVEIDINLEKLELASDHHGVGRLTVTDKNGFTQPQLILRLHYEHGRTVIVLLGLPNASTPPGHSRDFSQAYQLLEQEARKIIGQIRISSPLLPSERYMLWRLRQIFY
jgi:hypothetical protein